MGAAGKAGIAVGAMGGLPGIGKPDGNMLQEIQMKQLKRAERAAQAAGGASVAQTAQQQQRLLANQNSAGAGLSKATGVGDTLVAGAASGALYAQRRKDRESKAVGAPRAVGVHGERAGGQSGRGGAM